MAKLEQVNQSNFKQSVLDSETPVLVDFWAEWCGPCKALGPVLEETALEVAGRAKIVKVNVDEARDLAVEYGIRGIPTMILFKGGKPVSSLVGNQPKQAITELLIRET